MKILRTIENIFLLLVFIGVCLGFAGFIGESDGVYFLTSMEIHKKYFNAKIISPYHAANLTSGTAIVLSAITLFIIHAIIIKPWHSKIQKTISYISIIWLINPFVRIFNEILSPPIMGLPIQENEIFKASLLLPVLLIFWLAWILSVTLAKKTDLSNMQYSQRGTFDTQSEGKISNDSYAKAFEEIKNNSTDSGLYARCIAEADGNETRIPSLYIKYRAIELERVSNGK